MSVGRNTAYIIVTSAGATYRTEMYYMRVICLGSRARYLGGGREEKKGRRGRRKKEKEEDKGEREKRKGKKKKNES